MQRQFTFSEDDKQEISKIISDFIETSRTGAVSTSVPGKLYTSVGELAKDNTSNELLGLINKAISINEGYKVLEAFGLEGFITILKGAKKIGERHEDEAQKELTSGLISQVESLKEEVENFYASVVEALPVGTNTNPVTVEKIEDFLNSLAAIKNILVELNQALVKAVTALGDTDFANNVKGASESIDEFKKKFIEKLNALVVDRVNSFITSVRAYIETNYADSGKDFAGVFDELEAVGAGTGADVEDDDYEMI